MRTRTRWMILLILSIPLDFFVQHSASQAGPALPDRNLLGELEMAIRAPYNFRRTFLQGSRQAQRLLQAGLSDPEESFIQIVTIRT